MNLAPIILFVYRRIPDRVINSLLLNGLAAKSDMFIFSDGSRSDGDKKDVLDVRQYIKGIKGFKSVTIKESQKNQGLANSVIHGVTSVINEFKCVIVLEDDLVVSSDFLKFMNEALYFYKDEANIWSISGYGPHLNIPERDLVDIYLSYRGSSWGWATWDNRWKTVDWDVKGFQKVQHSEKNRIKFERGGNDLYMMLNLQMLGKIDSWAIRWCFSQFEQNKYTIYPMNSKVENIGFSDAKAVHNSGREWHKFDVVLSDSKVIFPKNITLNDNILIEFKKTYDIDLYTKIGYFLRQYGGYGVVKKIAKLINIFACR